MRNLLAIFAMFLSACGGGGDYQDRYIHYWSSNGLIGQARTDSCDETAGYLQDVLTSGASFSCSPDPTSNALTYRVAVRLNNGDLLVWDAPNIERCNTLAFQIRQKGTIIGQCTRM